MREEEEEEESGGQEEERGGGERRRALFSWVASPGALFPAPPPGWPAQKEERGERGEERGGGEGEKKQSLKRSKGEMAAKRQYII